MDSESKEEQFHFSDVGKWDALSSVSLEDQPYDADYFPSESSAVSEDQDAWRPPGPVGGDVDELSPRQSSAASEENVLVISSQPDDN